MHRHIFQKSLAAIAAGALAVTSLAVLPSFSASAATTIFIFGFFQWFFRLVNLQGKRRKLLDGRRKWKIGIDRQ